MYEVQTMKQISVYLENQEGSLADLLACIEQENANILALCIADTTDFGIVRLVVESERQKQLAARIVDAGFIARANDVLGIKVDHRPGSLSQAMAIIAGCGQQIEYAYSIASVDSPHATIVMQTTDNLACAQALANCRRSSSFA